MYVVREHLNIAKSVLLLRLTSVNFLPQVIYGGAHRDEFNLHDI